MRGLGFRVRVVGRVLRLRNLGPCYERYGPQAPPAAAARRLARLQHAVRHVAEEIPQELMSRRILCRRTSGSWRLQRAGPRRCWSCRGHASRSAAAHQVRLAAVPPRRCLRGVRPPEMPPRGRAEANAAKLLARDQPPQQPPGARLLVAAVVARPWCRSGFRCGAGNRHLPFRFLSRTAPPDGAVVVSPASAASVTRSSLLRPRLPAATLAGRRSRLGLLGLLLFFFFLILLFLVFRGGARGPTPRPLPIGRGTGGPSFWPDRTWRLRLRVFRV